MSLSRLLSDLRDRGLLPEAPSVAWAQLVTRVTADIRAQLVPQQLAFLDDRSDYSVAYCSRQCGKGYTVARLLLLVALTRPNAVCVYLHQTYGEARAIMWTDPLDGIPAVLRQLDVPAHLNESRLEVTLDNGSVIRLVGADRGFWDKLRGNKLDCLVVDESQKAEDEGFARALAQVVPDCLAARHGIFRAIGTPDEFCVGTFHDICTSAPAGWTVHHWTAEDLSDRTSVWTEQLRWKAEHDIADDDPVWLREKRGLWVRQDSALMLPLTEASLWDGTYPTDVRSLDGTMVPRRLPIEHYMGLDFGFTDCAALVVGSVSREEGIFREVHSWKGAGLDTDALAAVVKAAVTRYGVRAIYADAADPKTIADLRGKWRLPVVAAEKHNKVTWIQDMRAKARSGRLQVLRDSELHVELRTLVPDPKSLAKKKFDSMPGTEDHAWDAMRYAWRGTFSEQVRVPTPPRSEEQVRRDAMEREFERRAERNDAVRQGRRTR